MTHALRSLNVSTPLEVQVYFERAIRRPPAWRGQLDPAFQQALAGHHAAAESDCAFRHTFMRPDGSVVVGDWDLRDSEAACLGQCNLAGKRVIEYAPGSGGLSGHIVRQGADLVVFDLPPGIGPEVVPSPMLDLAAQESGSAHSADRHRRGWWHMKQALGLEAACVYGDVYEPPADLGSFDVAVFVMALMQMSHPFRALQRAALMTTGTIIVTDLHAPLPSADPTAPYSLMAFNPAPGGLGQWWALSPETVIHMLGQLGFTAREASHHSPVRMASGPPLFTIVGHRDRTRAAAVRPPSPPEAAAVEAAPTETPLALGRRAHAAIVRSLEAGHFALAELGRVLDVGCGVGRVTRHWQDCEGLEIHGTDPRQESVEWCRENLPFASFVASRPDGALAFPDAHFGLVTALDVFAHLRAEQQGPWFAELVRVLRPGGALYLTLNGQHHARLLQAAALADFNAGRLVVVGAHASGASTVTAFHPAAYVLGELVRGFGLILVAFNPAVAVSHPGQDCYLLRKANAWHSRTV